MYVISSSFILLFVKVWYKTFKAYSKHCVQCTLLTSKFCTPKVILDVPTSTATGLKPKANYLRISVRCFHHKCMFIVLLACNNHHPQGCEACSWAIGPRRLGDPHGKGDPFVLGLEPLIPNLSPMWVTQSRRCTVFLTDFWTTSSDKVGNIWNEKYVKSR